MVFNKLRFSPRKDIVNNVISFFTSKITNPSLYSEIRKKCENNPISNRGGSTPNLNHRHLHKMGFLTVNDFLLYYGDNAESKGIPIQLVYETLDMLCTHRIISPVATFIYTGNDRAFAVDEAFVQFLTDHDALENLIYGFSYIAAKYADSVYKIIVQTENGESIGTGFHVSNTNCFLFTNKHVAKYVDGLRVLDRENSQIRHTDIFLCPDNDIALIRLEGAQHKHELHFLPASEVLDEIITVGYPRVPMTADSYQLVHKGEVNSFVRDYSHNNFLIISAKAGPGNSGGPVLNQFGCVIGMVTKELSEKIYNESAYKLPYHAAIPADDLIRYEKIISSSS